MLQQPLPEQYRDTACVLPIGSCLLILFGEAIGFLLLAVYCDNVLPDDNGMRQSLWCEVRPFICGEFLSGLTRCRSWTGDSLSAVAAH